MNAAGILEAKYGKSFEMLTEVIKTCPDEAWSESPEGRSPVWQIVCHALAGSWVWFRPMGQPFQEPPMGKEVAELEIIPDYVLSKANVLKFAQEVKTRADAFFALAAHGLMDPFAAYPKITNLDVILEQIRHIQHHVGYCNNILGAKGVTVSWK